MLFVRKINSESSTAIQLSQNFATIDFRIELSIYKDSRNQSSDNWPQFREPVGEASARSCGASGQRARVSGLMVEEFIKESLSNQDSEM